MPFWHNIVVLIFGSGALALFAKNASYRLDRLLTFLHPERDPLGKAYQLRQSLIAVGSGKLSGFNDGPSLGLSRQKFGFLPNPMTDSIFSIVGEELGFLGASLLVACFLFLAFWAVFLANKIDDSFGRLAILGIITWFSLQAFFNIGGNLGVLPLGGVPLPFFSFGGSHLIAELAACGLLLNISKYKK